MQAQTLPTGMPHFLPPAPDGALHLPTVHLSNGSADVFQTKQHGSRQAPALSLSRCTLVEKSQRSTWWRSSKVSLPSALSSSSPQLSSVKDARSKLHAIPQTYPETDIIRNPYGSSEPPSCSATVLKISISSELPSAAASW